MNYLLTELKAILDLKAEVTKTEVALWQRLSRALDVTLRQEVRQKEEQQTPPVTGIKPTPTGRYLSVKEAAKYLSVSRSSLYRMRNEGQVKYVSIGPRCVRYKIDDLDALIVNNDKNNGRGRATSD